GFLTFAQINQELPLELVDLAELESIAGQLQRAGIRVVENPPADSDKRAEYMLDGENFSSLEGFCTVQRTRSVRSRVERQPGRVQ
ncbi:MAG TPA: RNA polymerase sigma factor region1.1 domain-containing protein, partial [Povalibacter sp.]|nr:RNA polymerase sigma factor region1.1 domain-containing protein [Povalibacter sp.]